MITMVVTATLTLTIAGAPAKVNGSWVLGEYQRRVLCERAISTPEIFTKLAELFAATGGRVERFAMTCNGGERP